MVGANVIPDWPGGATVTLKRLPGNMSPLIAMMNGFHDGIEEKPVRIPQTLLGDALIAVCVSMVLGTVAATRR
jgi:hypothetical protein